MAFVSISFPYSAFFFQLLHSEPLPLSSPITSENEKKIASLQAQLQESVANYQAELLSAQARLVGLEGQVT